MAIPKIELEMTLAEMYQDVRKEHIFVPTMLSSRFDLTPGISKCTKYIYQHEAMNLPAHTGLEGVGGLAYVIKFLSVIPQQFAFAAGTLPVVMFDFEISHELERGSSEKGRNFAEETMSVLVPHQRPKLCFYKSPAEVHLNPKEQVLTASWPIDGLEHLPHTIKPEVHYALHSKEGLARSGLQTPAFEVITPALPSNGNSDTWLTTETHRIISLISAKPLPFALKLQQTMLGFGTYIIRTPSEHQKLITNILPNLLSSNYLPYRNTSNTHLGPANLIITAVIGDIAADLSLTLFVNQAGTCKFICGTTQRLANGVFFSGATIDYRDQDTFERRCESTMQQIGAFLHSQKYYGPVNADVLEDSHGRQWIVDLNVRMPGSYVLGALKKHFWAQRGLGIASLLFKSLKGVARKDFVESLSKEFEEGRVVIVAWYEDESEGRSFATLVVGAEDEEALVRIVQKVSGFCEE
ncbi:hypothetical protein P7C71_g4388, partial [Lecanoromycetidae sp. Uapishka_2]